MYVKVEIEKIIDTRETLVREEPYPNKSVTTKKIAYDVMDKLENAQVWLNF